MEYKITTEMLQTLLEGKKVVFDYQGQPTVILYPPNYGFFMTHEKLAELRRKIGFQMMVDPDSMFRELLGNETYEKVFHA